MSRSQVEYELSAGHRYGDAARAPHRGTRAPGDAGQPASRPASIGARTCGRRRRAGGTVDVASEEGRPRGRGRSRRRAAPRTQLGSRLSALGSRLSALGSLSMPPTTSPGTTERMTEPPGELSREPGRLPPSRSPKCSPTRGPDHGRIRLNRCAADRNTKCSRGDLVLLMHNTARNAIHHLCRPLRIAPGPCTATDGRRHAARAHIRIFRGMRQVAALAPSSPAGRHPDPCPRSIPAWLAIDRGPHCY